ncbi:ribosomal protein S2 [Lentinus tigrinus ALCF2SS1-7]|uniref:Ribosomal protein S2 n=1 Tax=Lentinus tigrinus ALCF2SS1-6 TaxID=1328759 RepID=A0A5C2SRH3_9APHY|nr:ribosomal protein S2 [Lentinus tigrinus ALCF2SS1-6]RPD79876.1 ribosomal protein S2 [Lentinus tigrinus ALCF2SS1-7]
MATSLARSLAASAARSVRRTRLSTSTAAQVRHSSFARVEEKPLETVDDWTNFQLKRAEYQTLIDTFSEYGSTQTRNNTFQPHHSLHRPVAPSDITLSALIASGAHFGHSQKRMNPNFVPYAYGVRAGITIIDLDHTLPLLRRAAQVVRGVAAGGGSVVFVGTRSDLRPAVRLAAERMGKQGYHVGERWLPGTLTNRVQMFGPEVAGDEQVIPDLVVFLNPIPNIHAVRECALEHVPTIGIVDSNVDPRVVMYPIPANDESTRTAELIAGLLSVAGREGVAIYQEEQAKAAARAAKRPPRY